jgi:excisionase family DNA binding protein
MSSPVQAVDVAPSDHRLVYSVGEAGELLGISRAFAYELVARGELPVIRMGRRLLVPKVALLALVAQVPSQQAAPGGDVDGRG